MLGLAFGAGLLVLLAGLVGLAVVLRTRGVDRANAWAGVVGAGVALAVALINLVTWWLRWRAAARRPVGAAQAARAARELAAVVREQWREAQARSLGDADPMPLRWRLSEPDMMNHDRHSGPVPLHWSGRSGRIPEFVDQFRRLRRRRLVIIGAPGSGKTTLAVQLLLELLEGWQPRDPVPVLFSLASWNPNSQPRVQDWLADQLTQTYPDLRAFGGDVAQKLADQGRLLPVLDGLDEIPRDRRAEVIEALNASLHRDTAMILTSRTVEYRDTGDVLTAAVAIEPEPLTASEAARYLQDQLPQHRANSWEAVLTALQQGTATPLAEVVASPLGLWLLHTVHIGGRRDPQTLIDPCHHPDAATIWHHLLEQLIPAVVRSRPSIRSSDNTLRPKHQYRAEQIREWLTTLAVELRDAQTRDWRWWQLARHTLTKGQLALMSAAMLTLLNGLISGLIGGLTGVAASGLAVGLADGLTSLVRGLQVGLVGGPLFGLVLGLVLGARDAPAHADFRVRGRARVVGPKVLLGLVRGLGIGLVAGLTVTLTAALMGVPVPPPGLLMLSSALGLIIGLPGGLIGGLISFAASPSIAQRAGSPTDSQRGDKRLTLSATCTLGLVMWLVGLLLAWFATRGTVELVTILTLTLGFGLLFGLIAGPMMTKTCWPAFVVASLRLGTQRRLPLHLMGFLDDAYRLGLLRVVGPVYQFRHAALQDHLAPPTESTTTGPARPLRSAVELLTLGGIAAAVVVWAQIRYSTLPVPVGVFYDKIADNPPVGTCISTQQGWKTGTGNKNAVPTVPCDQPHWGEILGYPRLVATPSPYPGADQTLALANFRCGLSLAQHGLDLNRHEYDETYPNQEAWNHEFGHYGYTTCVVHARDNHPWRGQLVRPDQPTRPEATIPMSLLTTRIGSRAPTGVCITTRDSVDKPLADRKPLDGVPVEPCNQRHWAEILDYPTLYPPSRPWPGDNEINAAAAAACQRAFAARVLPPQFTYLTIWPNQQAWSLGIRYTTCLAFRTDNQQFAGPMR